MIRAKIFIEGLEEGINFDILLPERVYKNLFEGTSKGYWEVFYIPPDEKELEKNK